MKVAALDLGSNTFLMLIAEVEGHKIKKVYGDFLRTTRLGQGVHQNRSFHPEALVRAEACLKEFRQIMDQHGVDQIIAVSTSAARDVSNREELLAMGQRYSIPIAVIPGPVEAELTFCGATFDRPLSTGLTVVDIGGGSTEVIKRHANALIAGHSFNLGSVRLLEMFVSKHPVPQAEQDRMTAYINSVFSTASPELFVGEIPELIAVAGTPTTLAALDLGQEYKEELIHGYWLSRAKISEWSSRLMSLSLEERAALPGLDRQRSDIIVCGVAILLATVVKLNVPGVTVSTRGVRFGAALQWEKLRQYQV